MATLTADNNGKITGRFTIPANVLAGSKAVRFIGKGGSYGEAVFFGQGTLTTQTLRQVRNVTTWYYDPLAQTFTPEVDFALAGVDLYFTAKQSEVRVQIREVVNGVPSRVVLAEKIVPAASINVTGNNYTRILFDAPLPLIANTEYAIVVLCDDSVTRLAIAECGKYDRINQKWVAAQAYSVGVLMSSSNAAAWTVHQDKDMAFRLLKATYSQTKKTINLGKVRIESATDLILYALAETPTADTRVEYKLTLPDGTAVTVAEAQAVELSRPMTGDVSLEATLIGSGTASPTLFADTQLLSGSMLQTADYFTRSIVASNASKAVLIYDAIIPSGATVTPSIQIDGGSWEDLTSDGATPQDNSVVEYRFKHVLSGADLIKARLVLTGSATARPIVRNIRFMAVI